MTTPKHQLVNGNEIRFRREQMLLWLGLAIVLGSGFIAGLYDLITQVNWHVFWLKAAWDNHGWVPFHDAGLRFIDRDNWKAFYRHGLRNEMEPAAATVLIGTFLANVKPNQRKLNLVWLIIMPIIILVLGAAGAFGITYLIHYVPGHISNDSYQWQELAAGLILGRVLHYLWAPVGATIQADIVERDARKSATPLWVRFATLPPVWRERWAELHATLKGQQQQQQQDEANTLSFWVHLLIVVVMFLAFVIAVIGCLFKYYVSRGGHIPFLAP